MEEIVKLRIIMDVEEDVFRDIEIELDAPLMHPMALLMRNF